ncbi:MAG: acyl-CoA thioesterase/BAAT N-terminal domain-containing protein [Deltaproteobacteria bacterium]|nr:acyl-CoA thioesterase/BAAT N-terminal domain-containing protein [Deltaproteobacteria bacterium]
MDVASPRALLDEPVAIKLSGFDPERPLTVRARTKDGAGKRWASVATFVAGRDGVVDLTAQAPIAGGYSGVHPMGLFWSMLPQDGALAFSTTQDFSVTLEAEAEGKILASVFIERLSPLSEKTMRHEKLSENGLVGTLYYRAADEPRPAIRPLGRCVRERRDASGQCGRSGASLAGYFTIFRATLGQEMEKLSSFGVPVKHLCLGNFQVFAS